MPLTSLVRAFLAMSSVFACVLTLRPARTADTRAANALTPAPGYVSAAASPWKLAWSDEFNGPDGAPVDPAKWTVEVGGGGFGNHELEYYTARSENLRQEGGHLVLEARKEHYTGADGVSKEYTSARLETRGKFEQRYGRFEASMKLPTGKGIWPAFWMLGSDIKTAGWPKSGEIDILETIGDAHRIYGTLHGPGYSGSNGLQGKTDLPGGASVDDGFHLYAVEWAPSEIRFFVDGTLYATHTPRDLPAGSAWAYDHSFFLLLNFAVGGDWPGSPEATTAFPQKMLVDYVRVYAKAS